MACMFVFYGISTFVDDLMLDTVYTYIIWKQIVCKEHNFLTS